jgi:dihydroxyacetone kinase
VAGQVRKFLDQHSVPVAYQTVGQFATSLDMAGFSISITEVDHELEPLLGAPCRSLCFTKP